MALGRRLNKKPEVEVAEKSVEISAEMQGSLSFNDPVDLKINGNFKGELRTKGTLTIGNTANVEASINGDNIVIAGRVKGDIIANTMLVLMPTAVLKGNINAPKLNIVEGAIFQGNCQMMSTEILNSGLLNIDEVSNYLEIDLKEIETLANSGKIPGQKTDSGWKFEKDKIDLWASSGKVE